jgi:prepilin-type N-terminal cleavage/methylation domain-containing protein
MSDQHSAFSGRRENFSNPHSAFRTPQSHGGFTLIELIAVICIVAILAGLSFPSLRQVMDRADSIACANNLRQIGIAVNLAANDNENCYPKIETDASNPIYAAEDKAKTLYEALKDYGITEKTLRCPADAKRKNFFAKEGTSYEWRPLLDGEPQIKPQIILRNGITRSVSPSKFRLVIDTDACHRGHQNKLYADGHVASY